MGQCRQAYVIFKDVFTFFYPLASYIRRFLRDDSERCAALLYAHGTIEQAEGRLHLPTGDDCGLTFSSQSGYA